MSFPYTCHDKVNKPGKIFLTAKRSLSIKQTAAQCCCLLHILPLLVASKVPVDDKQWILYLSFLDILDYILAPALDNGELKALGEWIEFFLIELYNSNANFNIKPKGHYLLHYATQYRHYGPLIHQSTMRYEGKHSYFKSIINSVKNYRNPSLTMARKHQLLQVYHHNFPDYLEQFKIQLSNKCVKLTHEIDHRIISLLPLYFDDEGQITLHGKAKYIGINYERGSAVVINYDGVFEFGLIDYCVIIEQELFFIVSPSCYSHYEPHLHSHVVRWTDLKKVVKCTELLCSFNLPVYCTESEDQLIVLKHHIHIDY